MLYTAKRVNFRWEETCTIEHINRTMRTMFETNRLYFDTTPAAFLLKGKETFKKLHRLIRLAKLNNCISAPDVLK